MVSLHAWGNGARTDGMALESVDCRANEASEAKNSGSLSTDLFGNTKKEHIWVCCNRSRWLVVTREVEVVNILAAPLILSSLHYEHSATHAGNHSLDERGTSLAH